MPRPLTPQRRPFHVLFAFALAYVGATIGFLPFLSLLLPMKVEVISGAGRIELLTAVAISGAVAASLFNILFGWLSDLSNARGWGRRAGLAAGIAMTAASYSIIAIAATPRAIVFSVMLFQVAINAVIAPLMAIIADEVPNAQKGVVGGMLALASPIASGLSMVLIGGLISDEATRLACIAAAAVIFILPALLSRAVLAQSELIPAERSVLRHDLVILWAARLLIQVAGSVLAFYLLYYFESIVAEDMPAALPREVGSILTVAYLVSLPFAILLGRLSDRSGRRTPMLLGAAILAAAGLLVMALAPDRLIAAIGFTAYTAGAQVFLSLHATFAMQFLPRLEHRGRDLGVLNLTNTLPALIGPALAWALATPQNFAPLMLLLSALTLAGGVTMLAVRSRR